jgi:hypothetical protein
VFDRIVAAESLGGWEPQDAPRGDRRRGRSGGNNAG